MRKALDKVIITPEMRDRQLKLRKFLKENNVNYKELKPIGFQIDISTIPDDKSEAFLLIANSIKPVN